MSTTATATKSRPILFSGPMVRAILAGTKTQTRRVVKPQPLNAGKVYVGNYFPTVVGRDGTQRPSKREQYGAWTEDGEFVLPCPYGQPGDELWVRETCGEVRYVSVAGMRPRDSKIVYRADDPVDRPMRWRPSIHMPRWASRITLTVKAVRVERLQDISEADAYAEGVELTQQSQGLYYKHPSDQRMTAVASLAFQWLWDSINGPDSWDANPWVWVLEFERKQS